MTEKVNDLRLSFDEQNKPILTMTLVGAKTHQVKQNVGELKQKIQQGKLLAVELKEHKEKRSLDANAYFHVLVDKIAKALNKPMDDVKADMVLQYGAMAKTEHNETVGVKVPKGTNIKHFYPYARWFDTRTENGKEFDCYIFYKQTHTLDSTEFSRLLKGTIQEAEQLGIETKTPDEIAKMLDLMRRAK